MLNKTLGSNQDQVTRMGNVGPQINHILGNLAEVAKTVSFATNILGGSSGGLFGIGKTSSSNPDSRLVQYQQGTGYLGATQSSIYKDAIQSQDFSAFLARVDGYETAWNTIGGSAQNAKRLLSSVGSCGGNTTEANTAITTIINPVLARFATATSSIATARKTVADLQTPPPGTDVTSQDYASRLRVVDSMSPTIAEYTDATQNAQTSSTAAPGSPATTEAVATPQGSFVVSGGTIVDQMNLLVMNAGVQTIHCSTTP
jgi:hypothetical protein